MTAFSPQQDAALKAIAVWLKTKGGAQVFRMFGYAGTGKTTLAKQIAEDVDGDVLFAAYTGKAALVLRSKGCEGASTIHSLIYRSRGTEEETPEFVINRQSDANNAKLIIIDECSMVDEELGRDLLSFGTRVLVLGDPAQLPPVKGGGFFTEAEPDVMLTEVHRQARDNPIVALSMAVREGERLARGSYGESRVIGRDEIDASMVLAADQVLVGINKTRRLYNNRIRNLMGYRDPLPAVGERLVCLRNDKKKGLLNGGMWSISELRTSKKNLVTMNVKPIDDPDAKTVKVSVLPEFFTGGEDAIPYALRRSSDEFDYGYALTVHKAQGSQWDNVMLFDESYAFREHRARWLYTGLTRAAERITVVV
ncbi:MAG: ATP-dependent RecD-like DNA helicase [Beijerinckiaceae bacterium]|nr:ATP-dependent RecD-like DNA helicase [Beijerinckiaceae bacterium]